MLKTYVNATTWFANYRDRLAEDQSGAALVEYSVLIGLITVAAVVTIKAVGTWISGEWASLKNAIGA